MLHLLGCLLRAFVVVSWRSVTRSRTRPQWSLGFETLVTAMSGYRRWLGTLAFPILRREAAHLTQKPRVGVTARIETFGGVPTLRCIPDGVASKRVIVYLHGGGFVFGSPKQDGSMIARRALRTGAEVVALA